MNVETTLNTLKVLSLVEKIQLIGQLSAQVETELRRLNQPPPRQSLRGLWRGLGISEAELAEVKQELWKNFPRGDI
jgi:hypothetical protein